MARSRVGNKDFIYKALWVTGYVHVLNYYDLFPALKDSRLHSPSSEYQQYHLLTCLHRGAVCVQAEG